MSRMLCFIAGVSTLCFVDTLELITHWHYCLALASALLMVGTHLTTDLVSRTLPFLSLRMPRALYHCIAFSGPKFLVNLLTSRVSRPACSAGCIAICKRSAIFLLAMLYGQYQAQMQLDSRLPDQLDRLDARVSGSVIGVVEKRPLSGSRSSTYYQRFLVKVDSFTPLTLEANKQLADYQAKLIQVSNYQPMDIQSGQRWDMTLRLKQPRGNSNPNGFDYQRYLLSKHIDASAYLRQHPPAQLLEKNLADRLQLSTIANDIRSSRIKSVSAKIETLQHQGLIKALLLGDRSALTADTQGLLQRTGTAHLLAISGLHIGIAVLFSASMIKLLLLFFPSVMNFIPRSLLIAAAALPIATFYAILAGLSISTQRALIMLVSFCLVLFLRRNTGLYNTLLLAGVVVLLIDPLAVLSAGFWFSFAAVAVLLFSSLASRYRFSSNIENTAAVNSSSSNNNNQKQRSKPSIIQAGFKNIAVFSSAQIAIFIAMPLIVSAFSGQSSLLAPIANLCVIPLISLSVVPLGIAGLLCSYISLDLASTLLFCADFFIDWILQLLGLLDNSSQYWLDNGIVQRHAPLSLLTFIAASCSIMIFLGRSAMPAYAAAVVIWLSIFKPFSSPQTAAATYKDLNNGDFSILQFDVGQGSAILIRTRHNNLLYDTGPSYSDLLNAGNSIIEPYLRAANINKLDTIIVSHGDNDHAGGADYLYKHWPVDQWLLGGRAKQLKFRQANPCDRQQSWVNDGVKFEILYPDKNNQQIINNENDRSCVLKITSLKKLEPSETSSEGSLLLTGDISHKVERQLLAALGLQLKADTLLVPHHGSISSSSPQLLAAVKANRALASLAYKNRYGHPHPRVIERYLSRNIPLYRSDQLGAVELIFRDGKWQGPYCMRYLPKHFWQRFDNTNTCIGPLKLGKK